MLDKQSPIPIYYQLEEFIKQETETGNLKEGEPIPSEREYAEQFGISRMTVRQALTNLVKEGVLIRRKGIGTFVQKKKITQALTGLTSFSEEMKARRLTPSSKLLSFTVELANEAVSKDLSIKPNSKVYKIERLRLADNKPMALETAFLPVVLFPDFNEKAASGSLYEYVENTLKKPISHATQRIEAVPANTLESTHLHVENGAPVLRICRQTYFDDETPFEVVETVFRGDRYTFLSDVKR